MPRSVRQSLVNDARQLLWRQLRTALASVLSLLIALPPAYVTTALLITPPAVAATYAQGNTQYQKGDFKGAETALKSALRQRQSKPDRIRTLKLLGICQFMLGNKAGASASFKQALALNPSLAIAGNEVLDDAVIPFFNAQRSAKPAAAPAPASPSAAATAGGGKPLKQTFLKVISNVTTAQISVDGIIAGGPNSLINTDPGTVLVEVNAAGYIPRKLNVNIIKNRENTVTVNLSKPQPKPKPKPKPKLTPSAPSGAALAGNKPGKKAGRKAGRKGNVYAPNPDSDLFIDDAAADPGVGGGGGAGGGGPDLLQQFEMETSGQQPYGAPQPYGQPAPGYGAPQPYGYGYAPPPVYYQPPPPTYYTPPPPPPPPGDPYAGGAYQDPAAPVDPAAAAGPEDPVSEPKAKKSGKDEPSLLLLLGPFGLGQFVTSRPILGLLFLGAQGGGLYYWKTQSDLAAATAAETKAYLNASCPNDGSLRAEDQQACATFLTERQAYVDDLSNKAMIGMALFGAAWAGGALEALLYDPPKPKKKRKKRKYSGFAEVRSYRDTPAKGDTAAAEVYEEDEAGRQAVSFAWDLGIAPSYQPETYRYEPSLRLDVKWTF